MFRLDQTADHGGTSLRGETSLPPAFMVKRFGKHDGGDGIRTSGAWRFVGESGEVFTVYEWRCTTLSNGRGSGSPTVREFWASWKPVKLHIGGFPNSDWQSFRRWLQAEYRLYRKDSHRGGAS
jgi:hypothetical protein